jgi:TorA maturation chaperone TorD
LSEAIPGATGAAVSPEDLARANLYALIGRLFYDAPDSMLLAEMSSPGAACADSEGGITLAWSRLRAAAASAYPMRLKQEYDMLFVGVGKAEVTPYTSHYIVGIPPDQYLLRLRNQIGSWGLARRNTAGETEDHVAGVCDVMRFLISDGRSVEEQRLFFKEFVYDAGTRFIQAIDASASAVFYRQVGEFARAFLEMEKRSLEMEEG